ncbi:MAG: hypothetical protein COT89_01945 [Candidatus Colwellbacteria bacterium CG10_big_fil_rev_8_21_14_0_10_42_22]|uniref:Uncharacterized protein n=1 Tax=Candidatus Colwellbacteria bacterium CG10_big_fil_rev_8_21_14_0_10_42_22 TaxID=1974540 RepID=A0A2H0VFZ0_9BACT|nr:MAG: hypothetical protein COT89_01945 [Candidatus Colwellbacteria bacterium CG10_big_fil_rev_8_21_14_0_10_42_22]
MVISLLGPSGIRCQVADFSLLVDPPTKKKGNLVLETEVDVSKKDLPEEAVVAGAGEYEISGVRVRGINLGNGGGVLQTAYAVKFDDIRLGFLAGLKKAPNQNALDELGETDILFVNIESSVLPKKELVSLIKRIEPSILIAPTDKGAKTLMEEFGQKVSREEKLVIKAKDINREDKNKIIWLKSE